MNKILPKKLNRIHISLYLVLSTLSCAQSKQLAVTIDEVPCGFYSLQESVREAVADNARLLQTITHTKIPVAIFINEAGLNKPGE
jgi:hypothetical protein